MKFKTLANNLSPCRWVRGAAMSGAGINCRYRSIVATLIASALVLMTLPVRAEWMLIDGARVHPDFHGPVPKKSDVIFSSRTKRPEALSMITAFEATRVEWVYSGDKEFISAIKATAGWFGGTLNANMPLPDDDGMAKDFDGNTIVHPRMKAWGGKWNTTTHPDTQQALRAQAKRYLDLGADSIQFDDPLLQLYSAYLWGGDFNPSTLAGFTKYLAEYPDQAELARAGLIQMQGDYREFLRRNHTVINAKDYANRALSFPSTKIWLKYLEQSIVDNFKSLREYMNAIRGSVPLSMNLVFLDRPDESGKHFFLSSLADYSIAETAIDKLDEVHMRSLTARALGIGFVPSLRPLGVAENRVAIATMYALGAQPIVPWDVYIGNDAAGHPKRMYGTVAEYGDLYKFVRTRAEIFDHREQTAVVGIPVPVHKFNSAATKAVADKLFQRRIPFAYILTGGSERKFDIDAGRVKHFKLLVSVNPDSEFNAADLQALRSLPVNRINAAQLDDSTLQTLSPFIVAGDASALKLYPRARPSKDPDSLVVHLIDEARGQQEQSDSTCKRRIGIKKSFLGHKEISRITWYTDGEVVSLDLTHNGNEVFFTVPQCKLWGILSFTLNNQSNALRIKH